MHKVLVYGSLNIDYTYSVPHIVTPGETLQSSSLSVNAGGKGANQSAAAARAGLAVYHAGKIGSDGLFLKKKLEDYGVDTSFVEVASTPTGSAIIQVDEDGQNSIVLFAGANMEITTSEIDRTLEHFSLGDIIILQNEINNIAYIMEKAYAKGLRIVFNPAPFSPDILSLPLNLVSLLVVNEIEGSGVAGVEGSYEDIISALVHKFPECEIVMTCGSNGSYYGCGSYTAKCGIVECDVIDTTAAGDTFIGYFIAARESGFSVEDSLLIASKASSLAVSRAGAMDSIPAREEVF